MVYLITVRRFLIASCLVFRIRAARNSVSLSFQQYSAKILVRTCDIMHLVTCVTCFAVTSSRSWPDRASFGIPANLRMDVLDLKENCPLVAVNIVFPYSSDYLLWKCNSHIFEIDYWAWESDRNVGIFTLFVSSSSSTKAVRRNCPGGVSGSTHSTPYTHGPTFKVTGYDFGLFISNIRIQDIWIFQILCHRFIWWNLIVPAIFALMIRFADYVYFGFAI